MTKIEKELRELFKEFKPNQDDYAAIIINDIYLQAVREIIVLNEPLNDNVKQEDRDRNADSNHAG